jgi:hypothetical protein
VGHCKEDRYVGVRFNFGLALDHEGFACSCVIIFTDL